MIALKYIIFACISTFINLTFQYISLSIYSDAWSLYLAMIIGTLTGLVTKYILDKKFIFYYSTENQTHDLKTFLIYSFMGLITTAIFWATEITFDFIWKDPSAKYVGAILGLSVGYLIKYQLDKKFVFIKFDEGLQANREAQT